MTKKRKTKGRSKLCGARRDIIDKQRDFCYCLVIHPSCKYHLKPVGFSGMIPNSFSSMYDMTVSNMHNRISGLRNENAASLSTAWFDDVHAFRRCGVTARQKTPRSSNERGRFRILNATAPRERIRATRDVARGREERRTRFPSAKGFF